MWWSLYFITSDNRAGHDFIEAWSQRPSREFIVFVSNMDATVPIDEDADDAILAKQLVMFYHMMQFNRGVSELLIPKKLERIDIVEVSLLYILFHIP